VTDGKMQARPSVSHCVYNFQPAYAAVFQLIAGYLHFKSQETLKPTCPQMPLSFANWKKILISVNSSK